MEDRLHPRLLESPRDDTIETRPALRREEPQSLWPHPKSPACNAHQSPAEKTRKLAEPVSADGAPMPGS